jgi:hypothetical protein
MKPETFRYAIIVLFAAAILVLAGGAIYMALQGNNSNTCPPCPAPPPAFRNQNQVQAQDPISNRDRRVLSDPLYPPLNRMDDQGFLATKTQIKQGKMYQSPTANHDSFRQIGYLSSTSQEHIDAGYNQWRLFGRMKDRNQGEYYIAPANNNLDLKIPLTAEVVRGERLRDVYTLPNEMRFNSPMLNNTPYIYTELPRSDLTDSRYI